MRAITVRLVDPARPLLPYLWGFAAAVALDHVIDVQTLFLPVLAGVAVVSAASLILRRTGR